MQSGWRVMPGGLVAEQARLAMRKEVELNAHMRMLVGEVNGNLPKDDKRMKPIYTLVSFVTLMSEGSCREGYQQILNFYGMVEDALIGMTVSTFMRWFPIEKVYDGKRRGSKDYYSTIEYLRNEGYLNDGAVISNARKLLWGYQNPLIFDFMINVMTAISSSCKARGEKHQWSIFVGSWAWLLIP